MIYQMKAYSIQAFHFVKILKEKKVRLFLLNIFSVNIARLILYLYE